MYGNLFAKNRKLLDSCRPNMIAGSQERLATLFCQTRGKLGGAGGFPGALQAEKQDGRLGIGTLQVQILLAVAEKRDHPVVHNLDELLARIYCPEYFFALGFFYSCIDKSPDNPEVDVCLEQGHLDFFNGVFNVFFRNLRFTRNLSDNVAERIRYFFQHG